MPQVATGGRGPGPAYAGRVDVIRAGLVPYEQALARQRTLHAERVADQRPDTCLLLEHRNVYTGRPRTADNERPLDGTPGRGRRPRRQDHLALDRANWSATRS